MNVGARLAGDQTLNRAQGALLQVRAPTGAAATIRLILLLLSCTLHADYQAGLDAYSHGDYTAAMAEWREVTDGPPTAVSPGIFVEAHYAVAMLYWQGYGVAQDFGQARHWLERAAGMNHAGAQAKLGFLYTDGKGVAQDHARAFEWFGKAARQGNVDALYNLGVSYLYGWGTAPDRTLAKQYLAAASALGDPAAEAALQDLLADTPAASVGAASAATEPSPVGPASSATGVGAGLAGDRAVDEDAATGLAGEKRQPAGSTARPAPTEPDAPVGARLAGDSPGPEKSLATPAPAEPDAVPVFLDETWIRAQNPQHYTIQVMALRSRESIEELMRDYEELAPFAVFTVQKGSKPLHVLLQGDYPDVESARLGKERFPRAIQQQDALWIRRFDMVQRLLEP